ncbi:DUF802 domain-containing protein [Burkholderia stagnalis]|uniref:Chemotaxis protein n=1 Tax=Burkholderia stagnalis TaxID=1503054 RepID=A0A107T7M8_9BURK|nr:DUF802 domain-containing protein [Burkholderia stagnalis]KVZ08734.1 chemotaxis protein [Burkholderia stagnalis]KWA56409.1 chemotaxis protein [Burkholderia stagnalis]KWA63237.1 chemotaxis protein [Burkholderia stagnalis]KWA63512.1 chemotaxis protein [Burkholderia stagnalis]KWD01972.1 chemotaxis protein [Burkholderia stagnalis]
MSRIRIDLVVFVAGLIAVCWIGAGYVASNPVAAAVTLLIAACYLAGGFELLRYRQATATLSRAVAGLSEPPAALDAWLDTLHPGLRGAVRARIEGTRAALPGPSLTPYLVGLLVLLGMLGTLLGMVVTLKGTGAALERATDLDAIRASLIAPVKGLGFAFGTSIAGVATSAMLGLLSALLRRERIDAAQQLDAKIATTLRVHSHAHRRDESFRLLQRQADVMPALVDRLQTMMTTLEQRSVALHEQQAASQQAFFDRTEHAYGRLASSVGQSLQDSAAESARVAGAALQPVMEATMAGLTREMTVLRDTVTQAVDRQLDGLASGFEATTRNVAGIWNRALADQQRSNDASAEQLRATLGQFTDTFAQRSTDLVDGVATRLEATEQRMSDAWRHALAQQAQAGETMAGHNARALETAAAAFGQHSASLLETMRASHAGLQTELASRDEQRLAAWRDSLAAMAAALRDDLAQTSASQTSRQQAISDALAQTARDIGAQTSAFEQHSASLLNTMRESHAGLQSELASRDEQRLAAWNASLAAIAAKLGDEWAQTSADHASRQQKIIDALAQSASDIGAQTSAFEQHSASLLNTMRESHAGLQTELASRDEQRLAAWNASLAAIAAKLGDEWAQTSADHTSRQQKIIDALAQSASDIGAQTSAFEQHSASLLNTMRESHAGLQSELASRDEQRLAAWNASLAAIATKLGDEWAQTSADHTTRQQAIAEALAQSARDIGAQTSAFEQHSASLLNTMRESHAGLQAELASRDEQRLAAWNASLASMAATLRDEWAQASTQAASRQQDICDTLARTANDITAHAQAHASDTINEISRLVQAASEAPKAAAEVVAELRQRLSDSMVRDTAMLEERSRLLATLETLLDAVNHASTEQRSAVDALVGTSADLLERVGARFNDTVDAETRKLDAVAAQVTAGAVEVASLGDAFGMAVHAFGESNDKLLSHLQRIEAALEKSLVRSDEQLEYYVAQAREVIDLSMMSQKQIVEDLQQLAGRRASVGA